MISDIENELNRLEVEQDATFHLRYKNFKEGKEKELGEVNFRKKHSHLIIKYVALKNYLNTHFRQKKRAEKTKK